MQLLVIALHLVEKLHFAVAETLFFQTGADAGFELASPMALAITGHRLLSLQLGAAKTGVGAGDVKGVVSAVPLSAVDELKVKRLLVGRVVTLVIRGQELKLESGAGANVKGVAEAFEAQRMSRTG